MIRLDATGYLAPEGYVEHVRAELAGVIDVYGRLVLAAGPPQPSRWAQNVWFDVHELRVDSIGQAARQLKAIQRNWWPYGWQLHRRSTLLAEALPHVSARTLEFPEPAPDAPLGSFTWLAQGSLLYAASCSSPFPNGEPRFREFKEHEGPPSRAYLKLFEALTLLGAHPTRGQRCLELGASPGGWTWVLARLGANVLAVDRAPLHPPIAALPNVETRSESAFGLTPERVGPVDWLFSDVICYPERLYEYVARWLESGLCQRFVCTLKFQSNEHYAVIEDFAKLPGARVQHLFHNRHELCWMLVPRDRGRLPEASQP
ncbi:MAG: SAM-dependent methyltransferase [Polyangiaceae bacterium]